MRQHALEFEHYVHYSRFVSLWESLFLVLHYKTEFFDINSGHNADLFLMNTLSPVLSMEFIKATYWFQCKFITDSDGRCYLDSFYSDQD